MTTATENGSAPPSWRESVLVRAAGQRMAEGLIERYAKQFRICFELRGFAFTIELSPFSGITFGIRYKPCQSQDPGPSRDQSTDTGTPA